MAENKSVEDVVREVILEERTIRYRRNLLPLCMIVVAVHLFNDVTIKTENFFVLPIIIKNNADLYILGALWVFILYNAVFFFYLSVLNWKMWKSRLTARREGGWFFPTLRMFYDRKSGKKNLSYVEDLQAHHDHTEIRGECVISPRFKEWIIQIVTPTGILDAGRYHLSLDTVKKVREKVWFFRWLEVGVAVLMLLVTVGALVYDLLVGRGISLL